MGWWWGGPIWGGPIWGGAIWGYPGGPMWCGPGGVAKGNPWSIWWGKSRLCSFFSERITYKRTILVHSSSLCYIRLTEHIVLHQAQIYNVLCGVFNIVHKYDFLIIKLFESGQNLPLMKMRKVSSLTIDSPIISSSSEEKAIRSPSSSMTRQKNSQFLALWWQTFNDFYQHAYLE